MRENLEETGVFWRSVPEIRNLLDSVRSRGVLVTAFLPQGAITAHIREVGGTRLVLECSAGAGEALLARAATAMHADMPDWHIEFMAAQPRRVEYKGAQAIEMTLPDVIVQHKARAHPRVKVQRMALQCEADREGITPFQAVIVDLSVEGLGFLVYPPDISLEPGTVLRGCRIDVPLEDPLIVDVEVRYSQPVTDAGGRHAIRSGCRVLEPTPQLVELIRKFGTGR